MQMDDKHMKRDSVSFREGANLSVMSYSLQLLPGSSVHEILQTRILEWVAISSSKGSSQPRIWTWEIPIGTAMRYNLLGLTY